MKEFQINIINDTLNYIHPLSNEGRTAVMLNETIPSEIETYGTLTQDEYQDQMYKLSDLSTRNERQSYIIPVEKEKVLLNFIPQKTVLNDQTLSYILNNEFGYFITDDLTDSQPLPFTLVEGSFFRVIGEGIKDIKDYQYYIIMNGVIQIIPNTMTLEVMLAERELEYESIRVIESSQFQELIQSLGTPE